MKTILRLLFEFCLELRPWYAISQIAFPIPNSNPAFDLPNAVLVIRSFFLPNKAKPSESLVVPGDQMMHRKVQELVRNNRIKSAGIKVEHALKIASSGSFVGSKESRRFTLLKLVLSSIVSAR